MIEEKDLYKAPNGLYVVVMNGKLGSNMPGDVAGFSLDEALRLCNGQFAKGERAGQKYATPFKPKAEPKSEPAKK